MPNLAAQIVHGRAMKSAFNRTMDWVAEGSPEFSYSLRTILRDAAFPFRQDDGDTSPEVRDDVARYAELYQHATRNVEEIVSPHRDQIGWPRARVPNGCFYAIH